MKKIIRAKYSDVKGYKGRFKRIVRGLINNGVRVYTDIPRIFKYQNMTVGSILFCKDKTFSDRGLFYLHYDETNEFYQMYGVAPSEQPEAQLIFCKTFRSTPLIHSILKEMDNYTSPELYSNLVNFIYSEASNISDDRVYIRIIDPLETEFVTFSRGVF